MHHFFMRTYRGLGTVHPSTVSDSAQYILLQSCKDLYDKFSERWEMVAMRLTKHSTTRKEGAGRGTDADAAFVPAESSTSSVQHERQSFTRLGSLTISSNLLHFEQTSVSVKPSSRHPVVAGAACTKAANRSTSAPSRAWDAFCQTSIQIARAGTRHAQIPVVHLHLSSHKCHAAQRCPYLLALCHAH